MADFFDKLIGIDTKAEAKSKTSKKKTSVGGIICVIFGVLCIMASLGGAPNTGSQDDAVLVFVVGALLIFLGFLFIKLKKDKIDKQNSIQAESQEERRAELIQYQIDRYNKYQNYSISELSEELKDCNMDDFIDDSYSIILKEGEHLYYTEFCAASYNSKKLVVERRTTNDGFSYKIANGLYYRTGSSTSTPVRKTVSDSYPATLYITNKRVLLTSEKYGFELPITSISNIEYEKNYVAFYRNGKQYIAAFTFKNELDTLNVYEVRNIMYLLLHGADESLALDDADIFDYPDIQAPQIETKSISQKIREFKALYDDGIITKEEFETQKSRLLERNDSLVSEIETDKTDEETGDELLLDAIETVVNAGQCSVSMIQRRFRIGYNRAARLVDMLEDAGIVGPAEGSTPRKVLMTKDEYNRDFRIHHDTFKS